jgi:signal transduction histidine kinase
MNHFKQLFKPVPFLPQYMALLGFALTSYGEVRFKPSTNYVFLVWINAIPKAVITALALSVPAYFLSRLQNRVNTTNKNSSIYYIGIVIITVIYTHSQSFIEPAVYQSTPKFSGIVNAAYPRNFIPIFFAISLMGNLYLKLHREIEEKNTALKLVQTQNRVLIESEENSRATLASFLHDRVQASLVTVSMQISEIGKSLAEEDSRRLNSIIAELEHIRAVEVRNASVRLSPDLSVVGLIPAVKSLLESYSPSTKSTVTVESSAENWITYEPAKDQCFLGIYRIVQQVTLNAVVHGRATNIEVRFSSNVRGNRGRVQVLNDGHPLPENPIPGTGTAIINSWISILNSSYKHMNLPSGKVEFSFEIAL